MAEVAGAEPAGRTIVFPLVAQWQSNRLISDRRMFDSSREDQKQEITMQENTMTENHAKPERLAAALIMTMDPER
jgi:hypothetical protein